MFVSCILFVLFLCEALGSAMQQKMFFYRSSTSSYLSASIWCQIHVQLNLLKPSTVI